MWSSCENRSLSVFQFSAEFVHQRGCDNGDVSVTVSVYQRGCDNGDVSVTVSVYQRGCDNGDVSVTVSMYQCVFFFLAFAVSTIKAAREMNDVVFSSSCLQP